MKRSSMFIACLALIVLVTPFFHRTAFAGDWFYELGIGVGSSIGEWFYKAIHSDESSNTSSPDTRQVMLVPALVTQLENYKSIQFRVEGNLEGIYYDDKITVMVGMGPMLRWFVLSEEERGPYIEGGVGANYISRNSIGRRNLGGSFIFSLMGGVGYGFLLNDRLCSVSIRYRHLSNAYLYSSNDGFDSIYVMGSISF